MKNKLRNEIETQRLHFVFVNEEIARIRRIIGLAYYNKIEIYCHRILWVYFDFKHLF